MRVLCLDTSSDLACVGLVADGVVRSERSVRVSAQHGETLLSRVAEVLDEAGVPRASVELIAVGLGPGSFTGVRIGLATAKGLAIGLGKPIVGVRTSRALAAAIDGARRVVAIDGKKSEVFASAWSLEGGVLRATDEDVHGPPETIGRAMRVAIGDAPVVVCGSGALAYPAFVAALGEGTSVVVRDASYAAVRADVLAREALAAFEARGPDDLARLEPVYVRPADALLPGGVAPAR